MALKLIVGQSEYSLKGVEQVLINFMRERFVSKFSQIYCTKLKLRIQNKDLTSGQIECNIN